MSTASPEPVAHIPGPPYAVSEDRLAQYAADVLAGLVPQLDLKRRGRFPPIGWESYWHDDNHAVDWLRRLLMEHHIPFCHFTTHHHLETKHGVMVRIPCIPAVRLALVRIGEMLPQRWQPQTWHMEQPRRWDAENIIDIQDD